MKKKKKRFVRTPPSRKREWDIDRGILIVPYRRKEGLYGNYRKAKRSPDYSIRKGLINEESKYYDEYLACSYSQDGFTFLAFIKEFIEEEFGGMEGEYWIGGYEKNCDYQLQYLITIPVLKIEYYDEQIVISKRRSPRVKYGIKRKRAYPYKAIVQFPELEDWIV